MSSDLSHMERFSKSLKAGFEGHDAMRDRAEKAFGSKFADADKSPRISKMSQPSNRLYKKGGHVEHPKEHHHSASKHPTLLETQTGKIHHKEKLPLHLHLPTKVKKLATGGVVPSMPGEHGTNHSVHIPKEPTLAETNMKKGGRCKKAGGGIIPMSHGGYERDDWHNAGKHNREARADAHRRPFHDKGYEADDRRKAHTEHSERAHDELKHGGRAKRVHKAIGGVLGANPDTYTPQQPMNMIDSANPMTAGIGAGGLMKKGGKAKCHKNAGGRVLEDAVYKKGGKACHKAGGGIIPMKRGGVKKKSDDKVLVAPSGHHKHPNLEVGHYVEMPKHRVKRAMGGSGKIRHGEMTPDGRPTDERRRTLSDQY